MTDTDPVLARLLELSAPEVESALSERIRALAHPRLRPRRLAPLWTLAVATSVVSYLGWALHFSAILVSAR